MSDTSANRCSTCGPGDPSQALAWHGAGSAGTENLIDESHFMVSIIRCPECGQAHIHVFAETVDWVYSEDPQTVIRFAVSDAEASELRESPTGAMESVVAQLGSNRHRAQSHWPSDGPKSASFVTGRFTIPHD